MVQYMMRVALAGGAFLIIQLWGRFKGQQSYERFISEQENGTERLTIEQYLEERKQVLGAPDRLLSVSSFTLENLEGVPAPRNR